MTRGKENTVDHFNKIYEYIRSMRSSGLLRLERRVSDRVESGELYFMNGSPVYASTDHLLGQEALQYMGGWRHMFFEFLPEAPLPMYNIPPYIGDTELDGRMRAIEFSPTLTPSLLPVIEQSPLLSQPEVQIRNAADEMLDMPDLQWFVPKRQKVKEDVLSLPLTRPQRYVYLLSDGRRNIEDIARCTRRSIQEVARLLLELKEKDLIAL